MPETPATEKNILQLHVKAEAVKIPDRDPERWTVVVTLSPWEDRSNIVESQIAVNFPNEKDANEIANRIVKYYRIHNAAPDVLNEDFRGPDEIIALRTPHLTPP